MATEKTSLRLSLTDQSGNTRQKNITDINPDATNNELSEFVDEISKITTDIVGEVKKVTTTTDTVKDNLQPLNLSWDNSSITKTKTTTFGNIVDFTTRQDASGSYYASFYSANTNDKLKPYIKSNETSVPAVVATVNDNGTITEWQLYLAAGTNYDDVGEGQSIVPSLYGKIVVAVDATDTYDSDEITLTITEG